LEKTPSLDVPLKPPSLYCTQRAKTQRLMGRSTGQRVKPSFVSQQFVLGRRSFFAKKCAKTIDIRAMAFYIL
jgi:hypothetical protein